MTLLKICGLRDVQNTLVASDTGADFLGFVFVHGVRRQLTANRARDIICEYRRECADGGPTLVGLFADQNLDEVNQIIRHCDLDHVQLCGDEPPEYWDKVVAPIIKVVKVREDLGREAATELTMSKVNKIVSKCHIPMLDKYSKGARGGTGQTFDWDIAAEVATHFKVMLAGGLTPENVGEAMETVSPWAVDVSSGVEISGTKDANKIRSFANAVMASKAKTLGGFGTQPSA